MALLTNYHFKHLATVGNLIFFKCKFIYFNWRLIALQYCIDFAIHQLESATGVHGRGVQDWRRLLRAPWTARISNQSILKEISPEYSLEGLMLKLKFQYFGHLI